MWPGVVRCPASRVRRGMWPGVAGMDETEVATASRSDLPRLRPAPLESSLPWWTMRSAGLSRPLGRGTTASGDGPPPRITDSHPGSADSHPGSVANHPGSADSHPGLQPGVGEAQTIPPSRTLVRRGFAQAFVVATCPRLRGGRLWRHVPTVHGRSIGHLSDVGFGMSLRRTPDSGRRTPSH